MIQKIAHKLNKGGFSTLCNLVEQFAKFDCAILHGTINKEDVIYCDHQQMALEYHHFDNANMFVKADDDLFAYYMKNCTNY